MSADRFSAWKTRDGREIPLGEMETSHVENSRLMCLRNAARVFRSILPMSKYCETAADGAALAVESEIAEEAQRFAFLHGWARALGQELTRRGLPPNPPRAIEASADPLFDGWGDEGSFK